MSSHTWWGGHRDRWTGGRGRAVTPATTKDQPPCWNNEDLAYWHEYRREVLKWHRAKVVGQEVECDRLALTFKSHGTLENIYNTLDHARLCSTQAIGWTPLNEDGTVDMYKAYTGVPWHCYRVPHKDADDSTGTEYADSVASYDVPSGELIKFSCGVPYLMEKFAEEFEKSKRNTFTEKFHHLFNVRRRGRSIIDWLNDFESAKQAVLADPIGQGLITFSDFVWCNWIYETAELSPQERLHFETRMPDWRAIEPNAMKAELRNLLQRPEIPEHRSGLKGAAHARFTELDDEQYGDEQYMGGDMEYEEYDDELTWNDEYQVYALWDENSQLYTNSGFDESPAYFVWANDGEGTMIYWGTTDGDLWFPVHSDEEYPTYTSIDPDMELMDAQEAIWTADADGIFECLAVYPRTGNPKRKPGGRHEKEGDGRGKKNLDGLKCHRCGGDDHFGNNCTRPKTNLPFRSKGKGKGKGKAVRKGGLSKGKGKAASNWTEETYMDEDPNVFWGKGKGFRRRKGGKGKGKGKGKGRRKGGPPRKGGFGKGRRTYAAEGEYDEWSQDDDLLALPYYNTYPAHFAQPNMDSQDDSPEVQVPARTVHFGQQGN